MLLVYIGGRVARELLHGVILDVGLEIGPLVAEGIAESAGRIAVPVSMGQRILRVGFDIGDKVLVEIESGSMGAHIKEGIFIDARRTLFWTVILYHPIISAKRTPLGTSTLCVACDSHWRAIVQKIILIWR